MRILVVDDHHLIRSGIVRILNDAPELVVVGEADSGESAFAFCRAEAPDLVLMDMHMPGIGGLEATRKIVNYNPFIRVLGISTHSDDILSAHFMEIGGLGYITQSITIDEMLYAIKRIKQGHCYLSPPVAKYLATRKRYATPFERLSTRELQITRMIIHCQKVSTMANTLCLSPKTINSYRYRIFDKLHIHSDVELVLLALQYRLFPFPKIDREADRILNCNV